MQRVVAHPVLREDETVGIFLSAPADEFAARRDRKEDAPKGKFMAMVKNRASDLGFAVGVAKVDDPEPWFAEQAEEVVAREAVLTQMLQNTLRVISQYKQMAQRCAAQAAKLREFAAADGGAALRDQCERNAAALEHNKELLEDMACQANVTLRGNILDYVRELQAVMEVIDRRAPLVRAYTTANKDATAKPGPETLAKRDEALAALDAFSKAARADIQRVYDLRRGDMEHFFHAIARAHQECFTAIADTWGHALGAAPAATPSTPAAAAADSSEGAFFAQ